MKKALVFPGQGSQFSGMGIDLYENSPEARAMFDRSSDILGFDIREKMSSEDPEALSTTAVTQPAIYLHSVALVKVGGLSGDAVAGHSLGEFSALAAAGVFSFEDGMKLVSIRANAMQKACDAAPSTMAAIVGMEDEAVEKICDAVGNVVPANYNSPGQLVISGAVESIEQACAMAMEQGARLAKVIPVAGAFHSPFMQSAADELLEGIEATPFSNARIPVYQNVTGLPATDAETIKQNLILQLTGPVKWTQTVRNMIADGFGSFTEVGPGRVLQGLIKRVDRKMEISGIANLEDLKN